MEAERRLVERRKTVVVLKSILRVLYPCSSRLCGDTSSRSSQLPQGSRWAGRGKRKRGKVGELPNLVTHGPFQGSIACSKGRSSKLIIILHCSLGEGRLNVVICANDD